LDTIVPVGFGGSHQIRSRHPGAYADQLERGCVCGGNTPHQAQCLDVNLQVVILGQGGGESTIGIEESVGNIEISFLCSQISVNARANRFNDDIGTVEAVLAANVNVRLDLNIILAVLSSRIIGDDIDEVTHVNRTGES